MVRQRHRCLTKFCGEFISRFLFHATPQLGHCASEVRSLIFPGNNKVHYIALRQSHWWFANDLELNFFFRCVVCMVSGGKWITLDLDLAIIRGYLVHIPFLGYGSQTRPFIYADKYGSGYLKMKGQDSNFTGLNKLVFPQNSTLRSCERSSYVCWIEILDCVPIIRVSAS